MILCRKIACVLCLVGFFFFFLLNRSQVYFWCSDIISPAFPLSVATLDYFSLAVDGFYRHLQLLQTIVSPTVFLSEIIQI